MAQHAQISLKVGNMPDQKYVFTNRIYVNPADIALLGGTADKAVHVQVKNCYFICEAHEKMKKSEVGLNKVQREFARISVMDTVTLQGFIPEPRSELGTLNVEVDVLQAAPGLSVLDIKDEELEPHFRQRFMSQVLVRRQPLLIDWNGQLVKFQVLNMDTVDLGAMTGQAKSGGKVEMGMVGSQTEIEFTQGPTGKIRILSSKVQTRNIFRPDFNFEELGIGGLTKEFGDIFRRAFAARVFPPQVIRGLGITHVRGMLLHGPPGTGKTLIARQIAKFLKAAEPKIVNGPEILNKYVGQSEENIRKLFADAEKEQAAQGDNSQLHIIILDEIDAICKSRGSSRDSSGVGDSIVNQFLAKIDGVNSLNNILLIGMTNRMDMIDEALLRPGRLEVHVEISLPDEKGRVEILNIHTKNMRDEGFLDSNVTSEWLASQTKNFSGAELEGLIRSATSYSLNRKVDVSETASAKNLTDITVLKEDFELALTEVKPSFGVHEDDFKLLLRNGIISYSPDFDYLLNTCKRALDQVRVSENTPLLSLLLHGSPGCGKTALSAHLASISDYPFVRRIGPESFVGHSESMKIAAIVKIVEDAYKSSLSLLVIEDLERLMDYVRIGQRFSNNVLQVFFTILKKPPPKEKRRLLIIATTSDSHFLEEADLFRAFNLNLHVPELIASDHFKAVLASRPGFPPAVLEEVCAAMAGQRVPVQTLYLVAEMAVQRQNPVDKEVFLECLRHAGVGR